MKGLDYHLQPDETSRLEEAEDLVREFTQLQLFESVRAWNKLYQKVGNLNWKTAWFNWAAQVVLEDQDEGYVGDDYEPELPQYYDGN